MRWVVDCAGAPGPEGKAERSWMVLGSRAEVFNISRCVQDWKKRSECAGYFEACNAGAVPRAWDSVEHVIEERIGSRVVLVKRGKKEITTLSSDFKSGWWSRGFRLEES